MFDGGNPTRALEDFVSQYNWLGQVATKKGFRIDQNLARNLPGALMQDYLLHLAIQLCEPFPQLDVFTEVRVPFGRYPLWDAGAVVYETPCEKSDLAIGYLVEAEQIKANSRAWPHQPYYKLEPKQTMIPLVTMNTKIRVSQSEFFDWQGREQLMTKGNPHCLSVQVALRKEMDYHIVEAAQARGKFFLLGDGGESNVRPDRHELERLLHAVSEHIEDRMSHGPSKSARRSRR